MTDADLVRGVLNPEYFLGGSYDLSPERAREAIEARVAEPLGVDVPEAARRVAEAVQGTIADGVRRMGVDADTVVAFGGAGAVHAAGFAAPLDVDRVLVTPYSSVFSAFGESTMDVDHTYAEYLREVTPAAAGAALEDLHAEARRDMRAEGFDLDEVAIAADLLVGSASDYRVHSLAYEPGDGVDGVPTVDGSDACVRLHARGDVPKPTFERADLADPDPSAARKGERSVFWIDGYEPTPTYQREELLPGNEVEGPAVVEAVDTTVAIPPGRTFFVDAYDNGTIAL